jgi:hypothetical protein
MVESRDSRLPTPRMTRPQDPDESFTNEFGAMLADVRQASISIDQLLSTTESLDYDSKAAADMATTSKLLYWRFNEVVVEDILDVYRREPDSNIDFQDLVANTTHARVHPIDPDLGRTLIQSAKNHGGRPAAGVATLTEIQLSFELLGNCLTVTDIIDGDFVMWGDAKRKSVRRRINRGLTILIDAGFVSSTNEGRSIEYYDEGVTSLSLPSHSQSTTNS